MPAGAAPGGTGGLGASKTVTNGPDTVTLNVYPYDLSVDSGLQTSVEITFVGGIKSVRFDYGDGTSVVHNGVEYGLSGWQCEAPITAQDLG